MRPTVGSNCAIAALSKMMSGLSRFARRSYRRTLYVVAPGCGCSMRYIALPSLWIASNVKRDDSVIVCESLPWATSMIAKRLAGSPEYVPFPSRETSTSHLLFGEKPDGDGPYADGSLYSPAIPIAKRLDPPRSVAETAVLPALASTCTTRSFVGERRPPGRVARTRPPAVSMICVLCSPSMTSRSAAGGVVGWDVGVDATPLAGTPQAETRSAAASGIRPNTPPLQRQ